MRILLVALVVLGSFVALITFGAFSESLEENSDVSRPQAHIFIHGTSGSLFSFLSFPHALKDNLNGTLAKQYSYKFRASDLEKRRQPMLNLGLVDLTSYTKNNSPAFGQVSAALTWSRRALRSTPRMMLPGQPACLNPRARAQTANRLRGRVA